MSQTSPIEKRPGLVSEEVPGLRVAKLRRLARPAGDGGRLRLILQAPAGPQEMMLLPRVRGFGTVYEAACACGHRALTLRLDPRTGWWRCGRCLRLRSARSRFRRSSSFNQLVLPLLLLEKARRKMNYHNAPKVRREAFAVIENSTLDVIEQRLGEMMEVEDEANDNSSRESVSGRAGPQAP